MSFYRYSFYVIYRFCERTPSRSPHTAALGVLSILQSTALLDLYIIINAVLGGPDSKEIVLPYLVISLGLLVANYVLLEHKYRYLSFEDRFRLQQHPRWFKSLFIALSTLIMAFVFVWSAWRYGL